MSRESGFKSAVKQLKLYNSHVDRDRAFIREFEEKLETRKRILAANIATQTNINKEILAFAQDMFEQLTKQHGGCDERKD